MKVYIFLLFLLFCMSTKCQPVIEWQKTIGGNATEQLICCDISDNTYLFGGASYSNASGNKTDSSRGQSDFWLIKLDENGNLIWDKTYGGNKEDDLFSVRKTSDGGYIIGGRSDSDSSGEKKSHSRGVMDYWIIKIDNNGSEQWQKTFGGLDDDELKIIFETNDHGYFIGGTSASNISGEKSMNSRGGSDIWIIKLDSTGSILWQKTIGGSDYDGLSSAFQTADSGFFIGSTSMSNLSGDKTQNNFGLSDYWIMKLNSIGNIEWQKTIGGNSIDELASACQTNDGGYMIGGSSNSGISGDKLEVCRGLEDYWLIKLDNLGNIQWQRTIGGANDDRLWTVNINHYNEYILIGQSDSNTSGDKTDDSNGGDDYWILKLSEGGAIVWQKSFGGSGTDDGISMGITNNENYIFAGTSSSDSSGNKTENSHGLSDFWILKTGIDTGIHQQQTEFSVDIYPNPCSNYLNIILYNNSDHEFNFSDMIGRNVFKFTSETTYNFINLNQFSSGVYFLTISEGTRRKNTFKVIISK